jgi:formylglycine-generating enzyme required for sulfatase activity
VGDEKPKGSLRFSWDAVKDATGYDVYKVETYEAGGYKGTIQGVRGTVWQTGNTVSVTDTEYDRTKTWTYIVIAKNAAARSRAPALALVEAAPVKGIDPTTPAPDLAKFVLVEKGTFLMGSPESDPQGRPEEKPQHPVTLSNSFYLGKYEVTQAEWFKVMGKTLEDQRELSGQTTGHNESGDNYPIYYVSWSDAVEFCNRLSEQEGLTPAYNIIEGGTWNSPTLEVEWNHDANGYRLPTEAEWEYACRAGTTTRYNTGDDATALAEAAWYLENADGATHPVGTKKPNPWGLYDMHGNVWEYCWDRAPDVFSYTSEAQTDPEGGLTHGSRIVRGGAFNNNAAFQSSARRSYNAITARGQNFGLRLARSK